MRTSLCVGLCSVLIAVNAFGGIVEVNKDMGISVIPMSELRNPPRDGGVLVSGVQKGGAGASSGIKTGDVILKLNDEEINSAKDLSQQLDDGDPNAISFKAELWSGGVTKTVSYTGTGNTTATHTITLNGFGGDMGNIVVGGGAFGGFDGQTGFRPTVVVGGNTRPWLGIHIRDLDRALARAFDVEKKGVLVEDVIVDGPADKAGMAVGDIIRCIGETEVATMDALLKELGKHKAGDKVMIGALRAGKEKTFTAELAERPKDQPADQRGRHTTPPPVALQFGGGNTMEIPFVEMLPDHAAGQHMGQPFQPFATRRDMEEVRKQLKELREEIEKLKGDASGK